MSVLKKIIYAALGLTAAVLIITCTQYEFPVDNDDEEQVGGPVITLFGPDTFYMNIGDDYEEPGAAAHDSIDGDISKNIIIDKTPGQITSLVEGDQFITYSVSNSISQTRSVKRTVRVQDGQGGDYNKPVITLNGDDPAKVGVGQNYNDAGATATDDVDGDISSRIQTFDAAVNTASADTSVVWYMVLDVAGNVDIETRTVIVAGGDVVPPVITLIGSNPVNLQVGFPYNEPGATAKDDVDGDISDQIVIDTSNVNTNKTGSYKVTYTVSDKAGNEATEERSVLVGTNDAEKPVLKLNGANPDTACIDTAYVNPGATATDNMDDDSVITTKITVTGTVDITKLGPNELKYNVSDAAGNAADEITRTVIVADKVKPVVTLIGPNPLNLDIGNAYNEYGATATDNVDGNLTSKLDTNASEVNVSTAGKYSVYYTVSDNAGNQGQGVRMVNVGLGNDSVKPVITLKGSDPMSIKVGTSYTEPGATAQDDIDGDISNQIVITGTVDTATEGAYTIKYDVSDQAGNAADQKTRTVNVTSGNDVTKPVITVLGSNPMNIDVGGTYTEPGATALDDVDGDITVDVVISGSVNTATAGTYTISYNVSDKAGNAADEKTRTVNVNELSEFLMWDDFELSLNAQTTIAALNFTGDDGWWYGYNDAADSMQSTMNPDPVTDTEFALVVTQSAGNNNSKGLHVEFTLKSIPNKDPYCAVGFSVKTDGLYYNMSTMTEFRFYAKGSGSIRVVFETKMIREWPDVNQQWGHFGYTIISLSSGWTEIVINAADILPHPHSQQFADGKKWTDTDAGDKVTAIVFQTEGGNGNIIDLYLDEIKTKGLKVSDLGK